MLFQKYKRIQTEVMVLELKEDISITIGERTIMGKSGEYLVIGDNGLFEIFKTKDELTVCYKQVAVEGLNIE